MRGMVLALALLAGGAGAAERACPREVPAGARCEVARDARGAWVWTVVPARWNGALVVYSHGGPSLKTPGPDDLVDDIGRFAVMVNEGYAWTASSYRHAGYGVTDAAEDTEAARSLFWQQHGRPRRTLLHGQSWGANVAARTAELYPDRYDGVLLTSGVLGGGTRSYDFRADLRAVYQYYCRNLPAPDEPSYPLWQGLGGPMTREEVLARLDACTGVGHPAAQRTPAQRRALANIVSVTRIDERSLPGHLYWATAMFRDLTMRHLGGENPFSNIGVRYTGSDDDAALNAGVARFAASPSALARLARDSDPSGKLAVPTLTMHAVHDPTAWVELESAWRDTVAAAGSGALLVQAYTDEAEHSKLATPQYAALLRSMERWLDTGARPDVAGIIAHCAEASPDYREACRFLPGYTPAPLSTRVYPRLKPEPEPAPVVRTRGGALSGAREEGVERFLAVPYAAAERWSAPRDPAPWQGEREAWRPPPRCPQSAAGLGAGVESEQCLYLNVYRPAQPAKTPRAVYVYLHGGGAVAGAANDHDGSALAAQGDIVVVVPNYRLGAFGFMRVGEADTFALADVLQALRWVRREIGAFGGDPARVTLGGESAGGTVACPLLTMPQARGLFRAAILSSDDCLHDVDDPATAAARAAALAARLGCAAGDLACLKGKTPEQVLAAGGFAAPVVAPTAFDRISRGAWTPVPLLVGANADEGRMAGPSFFGWDAARYEAWLARLVPRERIGDVVRTYANVGEGDRHAIAYRAGAIITDSGMRGFGGCTSLALARHAARAADVYYYRFEDPVPPFGANDGFRFGAAHSAELSYLWPGGAFSEPASRQDAAQRRLSRQMIAYWSAFVRTGRPQADGQPAWPRLSDGAYLALRPDGTAAQPVATFERLHHCALWSSLPVILDRGEP